MQEYTILDYVCLIECFKPYLSFFVLNFVCFLYQNSALYKYDNVKVSLFQGLYGGSFDDDPSVFYALSTFQHCLNHFETIKS